MSNRKKTESTAAETKEEVKETTIPVAEVSESETTGDEGIKTPIVNETVSEKTLKGNVMYVGPTVADFAIQNGVYTEIPESARKKIEQEPVLGNLFIEIRDYPKANKMLRERTGYIFSAYEKALALKK